MMRNHRRINLRLGFPLTSGSVRFVVEEDSADYAALVRLFQRVRLQPRLTKGILRLEL